jgi:hypothetical protein
MSTNENGVSVVPVTAASSAHYDSAQARLQDLSLMRDLIPLFVVPVSGLETSKLTSAASVPAEFVELTTVATAGHKALVRGEAATPAQIRDLMAYADAYSPVADELEAFAQFIRHSVTAARNRAGVEALTTYSLAQRLAKRPEHAGLATYVADMRRALGRGRKVSAEVIVKRKAAKAAKAAARAAEAAKAAELAAKAAEAARAALLAGE